MDDDGIELENSRDLREEKRFFYVGRQKKANDAQDHHEIKHIEGGLISYGQSIMYFTLLTNRLSGLSIITFGYFSKFYLDRF